MSYSYETELYLRLRGEIDRVQIIDCHEHLQRESELPVGEEINIGRFFHHYASCDLVSAGMPAQDMAILRNSKNGLNPQQCWQLMKPWYMKTWNTGYCESLRIALRDIYGIADFADDTVEPLTEAMHQQIKPGFTRQIFDKSGIEIAMEHTFGPKQIFNADFDPNFFICDMVDSFTYFNFQPFTEEAGKDIFDLDDYLELIDWYFARYSHAASAFKVGRAYDRTLLWEEVPRADAERIFLRMLSFNDRPDRRDIQALEDFIMHYLVRKCGEYQLRMKFHTGLQEGNGNILTNSRAALLNNLFMKYPKTLFDIYHISYPYHEELAALAKNLPNVTVDFAWMWIINPAAGRRALSDMLDSVPANKIHGFGGDYVFVEGTYGHSVIARREITRVLCDKVEEGRFTEEYALQAGQMLLRDNALENFNLQKRRKAFAEIAEG